LKFFSKVTNNRLVKKITKKNVFITGTYIIGTNLITNNIGIDRFTKFLIKGGALVKEKINIINVLQNSTKFVYHNYSYICSTYPVIKWVVFNLIHDKLSTINIFNLVINLIKPPFIVKSIVVPKKLRKKIKKIF
jgi:hypothetical protein